MYVRLDDELIDHRKVFRAGEVIGRNGPAIALGFYALGLLWANKHLSDGFVPIEVIRGWKHVDQPIACAAALVKAGLWERNGGKGYRIHHYHEFGNPSGAKVRERRNQDKLRKRRERGN